jgi:hypothetical protein
MGVVSGDDPSSPSNPTNTTRIADEHAASSQMLARAASDVTLCGEYLDEGA